MNCSPSPQPAGLPIMETSIAGIKLHLNERRVCGTEVSAECVCTATATNQSVAGCLALPCYILTLQVLDERDATLRNQLGSVKDGSSELAKLTADAEQIIKDARSEVSAMVNKQKGEKQAELDKIYAGRVPFEKHYALQAVAHCIVVWVLMIS
eukprot:GHUV01049724.1.p1 GENE.GHUV01049724.1~~GHUV01049724.1.p1  ORF type:complete len:153 (-),score=29.38 GHUV01049724.1:83-541(-)